MTKVVRKKTMINMDEARTLNKYRTMFQLLCKGETVVIITESHMPMDIMFGSYEKVFNLYVNRGTLVIKTLSEATDADIDTGFVL